MKDRIERFLLGFPEGIQYKIYAVEQGFERFTLWDKIRYKLLTGKRLEGDEM